MTSLRRIVTLMVFYVAAGAMFGPAYAAEVDDLVAEGVKLRRELKDQEALALFQRAVSKRRTPRALAQLGLCEHALGMWVDAEANLLDALKSKQDSWIEKNEETLRADLARIQGKLGSIEIWGTPVGTRIAVDGHVAGTLPLGAPLRTVAGRRVITAAAPGFLEDSRTVDVIAGELVREHIALGAGPGTGALVASAPPLSVAPPPLVVSQPPKTVIVGRQTEAPAVEDGTGMRSSASAVHSAFYTRWWFWTGVGAVVIGGTVSAFLLTRNSCPKIGDTQCAVW